MRKTNKLPLAVKIAAGIPVILLAVFFIIFFSNPGGESAVTPDDFAAGDLSEADLYTAGALALLAPGTPADPDREAFVYNY